MVNTPRKAMVGRWGMDDKLLTLAAYGLIGLVLGVVVPFVECRASALRGGSNVIWQRISPRDGSLLAFALLPLLCAALVTLSNDLVFLAGCLVVAAVLSRGTGRHRAIDGFMLLLAMLLGSRLPWWLQGVEGVVRTPLQAVLVPAIYVATFFLMSNKVESDRPSRLLRMVGVGVFVAVTVVAIMSTGVATQLPQTQGWHHWGAYIAPARLVSAGAIPLYDIPLQYGFGPTLILSLGCRDGNCWETFYWFAVISTIAWTFLIAYLVIALGAFRGYSEFLAALVLVLVGCLLWTSDPSYLLPVLTTPSTAGVRFLPGLLLLGWIVYRESRGPWSWSAVVTGYLLWLLGVIWSPEAGFQTSSVWFAFCFWKNVSSHDDGATSTRVTRAIATLMLSVAGSVALVIVGFRLAYGVWPLWREYALYMLYPPGPLPITIGGPLLFVLGVIGLWILSRVTIGPVSAGQRQGSWIVVIFAYAASSYYLGRSADNNLLNLIPYFLIVLAAVRGSAGVPAVSRAATMMLAALFAWLPSFGFRNFTDVELSSWWEVNPAKLIASYDRGSPMSHVHFGGRASDLAHVEASVAAASHIQSQFSEAIEYLDFDLVNSGDMTPPWNALHEPGNFLYVPSALRKEYLSRVARRLAEPGWVLEDKSQRSAAFVADYDAVYHRDREIDFGLYLAIRYVPTDAMGEPLE